jgi:hypothetical protein
MDLLFHSINPLKLVFPGAEGESRKFKGTRYTILSSAGIRIRPN